MELDVAALQEARRKPGPPILRACIHAACQGSVHLFLADFYSEPVRPVRSGTWLPAVEGPYTKEYRPKEVRIGGATDIAVLWRFTTAVKARIQVPRDLGTAYVEPGEHAGRIMVHHVHVAEEPAVLASCHEPEVHLRTIVVVNESASGREVATCASATGAVLSVSRPTKSPPAMIASIVIWPIFFSLLLIFYSPSASIMPG